jgi:hypothetical protein
MLHALNEPVNMSIVEIEGGIYVALWSGEFGATMTIETCKKMGEAMIEIADNAMDRAIECGLCVTN